MWLSGSSVCQWSTFWNKIFVYGDDGCKMAPTEKWWESSDETAVQLCKNPLIKVLWLLEYNKKVKSWFVEYLTLNEWKWKNVGSHCMIWCGYCMENMMHIVGGKNGLVTTGRFSWFHFQQWLVWSEYLPKNDATRTVFSDTVQYYAEHMRWLKYHVELTNKKYLLIGHEL